MSTDLEADDEAKTAILQLYVKWPDRDRKVSAEVNALAFFGWLTASHQPVMSHGHFPPGDKYQLVKGWCTEWERLNPFHLRW